MRLTRVFVLLPLLVLPACGGSDRPAAGPTTPTTASSAPSAPGGPSKALAVQVSGGSFDCLEQVTAAMDFSFWNDTLIASEPLTITSVAALGHGVRALDSLLVPVVGSEPTEGGVGDWPVEAPDGDLAKGLEWEHRTKLVGGHLEVQRAELPFLHLRVAPGAVLRGVVVRYRTDRGQKGELRMPRSTRFSKSAC